MVKITEEGGREKGGIAMGSSGGTNKGGEGVVVSTLKPMGDESRVKGVTSKVDFVDFGVS